jgi:hypothetical protein
LHCFNAYAFIPGSWIEMVFPIFILFERPVGKSMIEEIFTDYNYQSALAYLYRAKRMVSFAFLFNNL